MIKKIGHYFSLVTFAHTLFALPFALIGYFTATQLHQAPAKWSLFVLVLLCMVFARNAAMGFNRWADWQLDAKNPRTAAREIPAGMISPRKGLLFSLLNAALFCALTWFINPLCFWLSPVALLVILGYSLTKRFTALCHFILGLGLSLAPIGAYLSVTGQFHWLPLLYSAVVFTWVSGFDIIYSLQDLEFDQGQKLFSIPVLLGRKGALRLSSAIHVLSALLVILAGILAQFAWLYWVGALIFILLLIYQHRIVKPDDLSRVTRAFGTTNGYASVLFALFYLLNLFL